MITALICTCNRAEWIARAVCSVLANTHPDFELIVVDQSTDDATAAAIAPLLADTRLRYLRTSTRGVGISRNIGLKAAKSEIVLFTDDDCETPPNWLESMEEVFRENPKVAVAFCNVIPGPYNPLAGFIPIYCRPGSWLISTLWEKCESRGIGAGLAVRREVTLALGGFDEMLGPGGEFASCEDGDLAVRALLKGYQVYETDRVAVRHHGFRTWREGQALTARDWLGIGAAYAKPLRCGHWKAWVVAAHELFVQALWPPVRDLLHFRKPQGFRRVLGFLRGFSRAWRHPIDPTTLCFKR